MLQLKLCQILGQTTSGGQSLPPFRVPHTLHLLGCKACGTMAKLWHLSGFPQNTALILYEPKSKLLQGGYIGDDIGTIL